MDCLVGKVLGLRGRIAAAAAVTEHRLIDLALGNQLQLGLLIGVTCKLSVAPFRGKVIIRADARKQARLIAGLGDIVETRVVHDGRRGAVVLDPISIAQLLDGIARRGLHIVREAERMPHFVRDNKPNQLTDEIIRHGQTLCAFIDRRRLHEIPVAHELLYIVIHANVRFENLAGARIAHMRAEGVLDAGRQPTNG